MGRNPLRFLPFSGPSNVIFQAKKSEELPRNRWTWVFRPAHNFYTYILAFSSCFRNDLRDDKDPDYSGSRLFTVGTQPVIEWKTQCLITGNVLLS